MRTTHVDTPRDTADEHAAAITRVREYHLRTRHLLERYAAGPETLDWDAQPDPFRRFAGSDCTLLPYVDDTTVRYADLYQPGRIQPRPLTQESLSLLFELAFGISAWKHFGSARWAVRNTPSSGNLHPTEAYAVLPPIAPQPAGVYHYASLEHAFEQRCRLDAPLSLAAEHVLIGLSSIHWREAWKYGERAFRYCQLDIGHAIAALRYAAGVCGWRVRRLTDWSDAQIATVLGLDRNADFQDAEPEHPEVMLLIDTAAQADTTPSPVLPATLAALATAGAWRGRANTLDPAPLYRWPVIDEVAAASRRPADATDSDTPVRHGAMASAVKTAAQAVPAPAAAVNDTLPATQLIRQRRSAQAFDGSSNTPLAREAFYRMLTRLLPLSPGAASAQPPWDALPGTPRLHPVFFVHRVAGLPAGLYALPRSQAGETLLRANLREVFAWDRPADCPAHLPLYHLLSASARRTARTLSCHQAIAADSLFSLGMLAEFDAALAQGPWAYRELYWEAGMLGHTLYLEAEAHGLRGTGIGCFFDAAVHELLGIADTQLQSLYHFTVGEGLSDPRILTLPPTGRARERKAVPA